MDKAGPNCTIVLDQFSRSLAEAETLEQITDLRSRAEAVRIWAKSAALGLEMQNRAAEMKLRAERKAGELLSKLNLRGGDRRSVGHEDRLNLSALGVSQNQSKRWQKEAEIPEAEFQRYVSCSTELGEEITAAGLLRLARRPVPTPNRRHGTLAGHNERRQNCNGHESPLSVLLPDIQRTRNNKCEEPNSPYEAGDVAWIVQELKNHHAMLANLLEPVCAGDPEPLLPAQRRGIQRYLSEFGQLLEALRSCDVPRQHGASSKQTSG